jgi:large subunit ribosomal protein L18
MKERTNESRIKRRMRVRRKLIAKSQRPRLTVFRSNKHIYAQIIDDQKGKTLVQANDMEIRSGKNDQKSSGIKNEDAMKVGALIAQRAGKVKVQKVAFDRSSYKYHGRIKSLAEEARKNGLIF